MTLFTLIILIAFIALFFVFKDIASSFLGIIVILVLAWLLWYSTGGVERFENSNQGAFIRPTNNYTNFETYGEIPRLPTQQTSTSTRN